MPGIGDALPNPSGVKLTYDDFVLFPDDGLRHELIDGEHNVTPSPNVKHQQVVMNLRRAPRQLAGTESNRPYLLRTAGHGLVAIRHRGTRPGLYVD
jgi:hypothetical protein